ncbi:SUKH-3 domain-containing protein [Clostridium sporogenes]|uniref:SUKH-3 domain-containing protein n=1 Tax=Clostridium sporogenes TaxID=1509 RepID=UPI0028FE7E5E|nr:SUKH-3 domain-containing protein [Clostridium botulinum]
MERIKSRYDEPSFESDWNVDNCAEIWSARDLVLKGGRFDDFVIRTEKTIEELKKAGWYEGRKIDITEQIKCFEGNGYEMFDAAYDFLEQYGNFKFILQYEFRGKIKEDIHSTCYKEMQYYYERNTNYYKKVGEKIIPVCKLYSGEYIVCISESGKFFVSEGMWAENIDDFWNGLLGEYQGDFLNWIDYKASKEIQCCKYKNKNYF